MIVNENTLVFQGNKLLDPFESNNIFKLIIRFLYGFKAIFSSIKLTLLVIAIFFNI